MTLTELIHTIEDIASAHTLVNSTFNGDIYDNFSEHDIKYGAFNVDIEYVERGDVGLSVNLYMYYADRLLQNKSNALAIKDDAVSILQSTINSLKRNDNILDCSKYTITPFEQKFDDYLAGGYVRLTLLIKSTISNCNMESVVIGNKTINITENGQYDISYYDRANINVEGGTVPTGSINITENGEYNVAYKEIATVNVDTQTPYQNGYQDGYDEGYTDGEESVDLDSITITENGEYTLDEGGWNDVTVNIPQPSGTIDININGDYNIAQYENVHVDVQGGITPTGSINITENGEYNVTDVATAIVDVDIITPYENGYADGVASVPLTSVEITENGTYSPSEGGYNNVVVNVPSVTTQTLTQAQYDALTEIDCNVIYLIKG